MGRVPGATSRTSAANTLRAVIPIEFHRNAPKVGRNDPCPCGSGRKYKHCHGQLA